MYLSILRGHPPTRFGLVVSVALWAAACGQPTVFSSDEGAGGFSAVPGFPCDVDTDLDGAVDCEDPAPYDTHEVQDVQPPLSAAHSEQRVRHSVSTASWDGRLVFGVQKNDAPTDYDYTVAVFRPEVVDIGSDGHPDLRPNRVFSGRVLMENSDTSLNRLHLSVGPNPDFPRNPYPGTSEGHYDPDGTFDVYELLMIGKELRPDFPSADNEMPYLTITQGRVVVRAPRTPDAEIERALVTGQAEDIRTSGDGYAWGYEPSISMDGRLIVFSGRANARAGNGGATSYIFNSVPNRASGWSEPRPISSMYWTHGPGAPSETRVAGILFSELYPIAKQPLRDPTGRVYQPGEWIQGPYPWLSFDSSEIFIQSVRTFYGPTRSAATAVGVRTNWTLRHLDGPINPTRARLASDGRIDHWDFTPEGEALRRCYELQTLGDDATPMGPHGFHRITMTSLGLFNTLWDPQRDAGHRWLPMHPQGSHVYGIMLSHSRRYVEVPLGQVPDAQYLVYLPMNEQLEYDHYNIAREVNGVGSTPGTDYRGLDIWGLRGSIVRHSTSRTPDVSGNLNNGSLQLGAAFPYEYEDAYGRWMNFWNRKRADPSLPPDADAVSGDRIRGVWGNAIYFPYGSNVRVDLNAQSRSRMQRAQRATVMLWVKPSVESVGRDFPLFSLDSVFTVAFSGDELVARAATTTQATELRVPRPASQQWAHIALVRNTSSVSLFVDGSELARRPLAGAFGSAAGVLRVGPYAGGSREATTMALIDEVSLSDVARTRAEIDAAAFRRRDPRPARGGPAQVSNELAELPRYTPAHTPQTQSLANLGKRLFFDPILSRDQSVSCATCHDPSLWFTDGATTAIGIDGNVGTRNTPSVANRLFGPKHFLDGRASSLEAQALEPIPNPIEMDLPLDEALTRLGGDNSYRTAFDSALGGVSEEGLAQALAAYIRTLVSGQSRFDTGHMTPAELRGQGLFFGRARCAMCHNGPNFTDEDFHNIGLGVGGFDTGRRGSTGRASETGAFRTPSLRNVSQTRPYLHDGSAPTLMDVIDLYDDGGLETEGRDVLIQPLGLTDQEKQDLRAFLMALTGTTLARTSEGPAAQIAPSRATLVDAGLGTCAGTCLWVLGVNITTQTELLVESLDGTLLGVYSGTGILSVNLERGLWLEGYQGAWDRATLVLGADEQAALNTTGLVLRSEDLGTQGEAIYLSPEGRVEELPPADDPNPPINPPTNTDAYDLVSTSLMRVDFDDGFTTWGGEEPTVQQGASVTSGFEGGSVSMGQTSELRYEGTGLRNDRGTISLWVKTNWDGENSGALHPTHGLLSIQPTPWRDEIRLYVWKRRVLGLRTYSTTGGTTQTWTANMGMGMWERDRWYHVAATWDAAQGRIALYVDGDLVTQTTGWTPPVAPLSGAPITVGSLGHVSNEGLEGALDEVTVFARALTEQEIGTLALGPVAIPADEEETDPDPDPEPTIPDPLGQQASLVTLFDDGSLFTEAGQAPVDEQNVSMSAGIEGGGLSVGTGGRLAYNGGSVDVNEGTVGMWVRTNWDGEASGDFPSHTLFAFQPTPWNDDLWVKFWRRRTLSVRSYRRGSAPASTYWVVNTSIPEWEAGRWYHVAATWSVAEERLALYLDGELIGESIDWAPPIEGTASTDMVLGNTHTMGESLDGTLDEIHVFQRALTPEEISVLAFGE